MLLRLCPFVGTDPGFMRLRGRHAQPASGRARIECLAFAGAQHYGQRVLGVRFALLGGEAHELQAGRLDNQAICSIVRAYFAARAKPFSRHRSANARCAAAALLSCPRHAASTGACSARPYEKLTSQG